MPSMALPNAPNMLEFLMSSLQGMRHTKEMCDITVRSMNDVEHEAHSIILAAASPVFKVMVTKEFKEFHSKVITIPDVDEDVMEQIIEFIYTGVIELDNDNVMEMFAVADRLEISSLIQSCKVYIMQQIDETNCIGVRRLGERYCHHDMVQTSTKYMLQMFNDFSQSMDFLELSFFELIEYLKHDELNVEREEMLFDIIFRWIDHDKNSRKGHLEELLKNLRFNIMHVKHIEKIFASHSALKIKHLQKLGKLIVKVCREFNKHANTDLIEKYNIPWWQGYHRVPAQLIFCVGGWNRGRTLDLAECFNTKSRQWYIIDHIRDPAGGRCYSGIVFSHNLVFVVGGYDGRHYLNTVRRYNPLTLEWAEVANMHIRRCFIACVAYNDELYAIAGFDGSRRLTSVEKYSYQQNQWTLMQPLNTPRSDAASVVHDGRIYVIGGYGGNSLCSCEVYDNEEDRWQYVMQMNCKRSGATAVSVPEQNKIFVMGGYNGTTRVNTTEYYDPQENTWTDGPAMINSRSNFATCIIGKSLYVIGGYTGHSTICDVEKYDFVERCWISAAPLNYPRSAMKAILLGNLPNVAEYFKGGTQTQENADMNPDNRMRRLHQERQTT